MASPVGCGLGFRLGSAQLVSGILRRHTQGRSSPVPMASPVGSPMRTARGVFSRHSKCTKPSDTLAELARVSSEGLQDSLVIARMSPVRTAPGTHTLLGVELTVLRLTVLGA